MNTGILAHILLNHTHCGEFIPCFIFYKPIILSCMCIFITHNYFLQSTIGGDHSARVESISTEGCHKLSSNLHQLPAMHICRLMGVWYYQDTAFHDVTEYLPHAIMDLLPPKRVGNKASLIPL